MKKNKTKFCWKCPHCSRRNTTEYNFTFEIANHYTNTKNCSYYTHVIDCSKCGTKCELAFSLSVKKMAEESNSKRR